MERGGASLGSSPSPGSGGAGLTPGTWGTSLLMCEGAQTMNHSLNTLADLSELQTKIMGDSDNLEKDMLKFQTNVSILYQINHIAFMGEIF